MRYIVVIPVDLVQPLEAHEVSAALILAEYFESNVYVIPTGRGKTADFLIDGVRWEVKSPTGAGKHNIQRVVRRALEQSSHIVIDVRRSKIHQSRIVAQVRYHARESRGLRRLLLISREGEVIDILGGV